MPYYPDTSVLGPGALTGVLSGAVALSFSGPAQSASTDTVSGIGTVYLSGGANIQNGGSQVGFAPYLNFAGTAVASVAIASNTATITVNGVAGGGTVVVLQTGTVVGNQTGINFTGLTATFGNSASTATIPLNTAFGTDRSVQFNNAGAMSGADKLDIDTSGFLVLGSVLSGAAMPPTPGAGNLTIFSKQKAGRNLLSYLGPSGLDGPFQPMIGMNRTWLVQAAPGRIGLSYQGIDSGTLSGGFAAARTPSTTNFSSSLIRQDLTGAISGGGWCGWTAPTPANWIGSRAGEGGFFNVFRLIMASTATLNTARYFIGYMTSSAVLQNIDPAVLVNAFGVIKNATGTTYNFFHCDATTANNRQIDTGITHNVGDVVEIRIFAKPSATQINMSLEVISVGGSGTVGAGPYAEYATTGNLTAVPVNTQLLNPRIALGSTAGTSGPKIGIISIYGESDY